MRAITGLRQNREHLMKTDKAEKSGMVILPLEHNDIGAVVQLERSCFSQPWSAQVFEAELKNKSALFLVAKRQGEIQGYIGLHIVLDEGYIANVAVSPDARRSGTGQVLLGAACEIARERRLRFLTLEVRESNFPAIRLYEKMAFAQVGRRPAFYSNPKEDALLMTRFFSVGESSGVNA